MEAFLEIIEFTIAGKDDGFGPEQVIEHGEEPDLGGAGYGVVFFDPEQPIVAEHVDGEHLAGNGFKVFKFELGAVLLDGRPSGMTAQEGRHEANKGGFSNAGRTVDKELDGGAIVGTSFGDFSLQEPGAAFGGADKVIDGSGDKEFGWYAHMNVRLVYAALADCCWSQASTWSLLRTWETLPACHWPLPVLVGAPWRFKRLAMEW